MLPLLPLHQLDPKIRAENNNKMKFLIITFTTIVAASAEAEADAGLLLGGAYAGLPYAAPVAVAKSAPCVNAANVPVPCAAGVGLAGLGYASLGYAGLGIYGRKKREAEADAGLLLGGAYAALPYAAPVAVAKSAPCVNAANVPVPCAAGVGLAGLGYAGLGYAGLGIYGRKKREAEAD